MNRESWEGEHGLITTRYISELSPSAFRGQLVTLSILFITLGQVVAYVFGWIFSMKVHGWRWMVGLGAAPAILQFGLLIILPETPRWLVKNGDTEAARAVLRKVYSGTESVARDVLQAIDREISEEEAVSQEAYTSTPGRDSWTWLNKVHRALSELVYVGGNRRALTIGCLLQALQQLCGFVRSYCLHSLHLLTIPRIP